MDSNKAITLEAFKQKAIQRAKDKKLFVMCEVPDYGQVKFERPEKFEKTMLAYMNGCGKATKTEKNDKGERVVVEQDMTMIFDVSNELVFKTCPFLRDSGVQAALGVKDPMEAPSAAFGINMVIELAGEIFDAFDGNDLKSKAEDDAKNSSSKENSKPKS